MIPERMCGNCKNYTEIYGEDCGGCSLFPSKFLPKKAIACEDHFYTAEIILEKIKGLLKSEFKREGLTSQDTIMFMKTLRDIIEMG